MTNKLVLCNWESWHQEPCEPAEERSQRRQHHRQDAPGARRGGQVGFHGDHEFRRVGEDDFDGRWRGLDSAALVVNRKIQIRREERGQDSEQGVARGEVAV